MEEETLTNTNTSVNPSSSDELLVDIENVITQVEFITKESRNISNELRILKKKYMKVLKLLRKKRKNRRETVTVSSDSPPTVKREPSGFASPVFISNDLANFLGIPEGTKIARTDVTKMVIKYVQDNDLKSKTEGRMFDLSDESNPKVMALRQLLKIDGNVPVGYFTLQTHLKHHFNKPSKEGTNNKEDLADVQEDTMNSDLLSSNTIEDTSNNNTKKPKRKLKVTTK